MRLILAYSLTICFRSVSSPDTEAELELQEEDEDLEDQEEGREGISEEI